MASAVYSEPPASRLSIALEGEASVSPFPSPSSSFLPPPTPGAHEFAVKPAPAARNSRKLSTTAHITTAPAATTPTANGDAAAATPTAPHAGLEVIPPRSSSSGVLGPALTVNGLPQLPVASPSPLLSPSPSAPGASTISTTKESTGLEAGIAPSSPSMLSPTTPTPYSLHHQTGSSSTLEPPKSPGAEGSTSSSTTPTIQTLALPPEDAPIPYSADPLIPPATLPTTPTTATAKTRPRHEDEYPAKIIIPSSLEAALTGLNGASAPASPAFSTFSNTSRSRPLSTSFAPADPVSSTSASSPSLFSNRPAPPSPALSRRVSGVPSLSGASTRSRPSRPPSQVVSRANSLRKSTSGAGGAGASPMMHPHRLSQSFAASPLPSPPASPAFALSVSGPPPAEASTSAFVAQVPAPAPAAARSAGIRVRDFGFPASDERHRGLGPEVPRANTVARLNRRLGAPRAHSVGGSSVASSDDGRDEDEDDEDGGWGDADGGWGSSSVFGTLRWGYPAGAGAVAGAGAGGGAGAEGSGFPSQGDLDENFRTDEEWDDEGAPMDDEDEDALYPGLYRALYAFEPEGTAEMRLVEDQLVRVVGRGGGVGWAVVVDPSAGPGEDGEDTGAENGVRHALVPESYLEPVRLDWEDEEAAAGGAVEVPTA